MLFFGLLFAFAAPSAGAREDVEEGRATTPAGWSVGLSTGYYYQSADLTVSSGAFEADQRVVSFNASGTQTLATIKGMTTNASSGYIDEATESGISIASQIGYYVEGGNPEVRYGIEFEPEIMFSVSTDVKGRPGTAGETVFTNSAGVAIDFNDSAAAENAARVALVNHIIDTVNDLNRSEATGVNASELLHPDDNDTAGSFGWTQASRLTPVTSDPPNTQQQRIRHAIDRVYSDNAGVFTTAPITSGDNAATARTNLGLLRTNGTDAEREAYRTGVISEHLEVLREIGVDNTRLNELLRFALYFDQYDGVEEGPGNDVTTFTGGAVMERIFGDHTITGQADLPVATEGLDSTVREAATPPGVAKLRATLTDNPSLVHISLPVYAVANMHSERFNANFGVGTGVMFYDVGNELSDGKAWPILAKTSINVPVNDRVSVGGGLRFHYSLISSGDIDSIWGIRADAGLTYRF